MPPVDKFFFEFLSTIPIPADWNWLQMSCIDRASNKLHGMGFKLPSNELQIDFAICP